MPETAAGTTTRSVVVDRRAPRPYEASRSERGTARIASSETDAMSGIGQDADADAGGREVEAGCARDQVLDDDRADEREGEEPEHDARDAGEDLEDRLDDPPGARAGVLGQVDRAPARPAPR